MWADLVGISLSHAPHQAFLYSPSATKIAGRHQQLPLPWVLEQLKPLLEDDGGEEGRSEHQI